VAEDAAVPVTRAGRTWRRDRGHAGGSRGTGGPNERQSEASYRGSRSIILDLGYEPHPETGKPRRRQKWHTFRGTRKQAQAKLTALLGTVDAGTYVDATKITLGQWLTQWFDASKARFRPSTSLRFEGIIANSLLTAPLASIGLQKIRTTHLEAYASAKVSASTLTLHHTIQHQALRKAFRDRLISGNPARGRGSETATIAREAV
jgi:hypothetical protein